MKILVVGSGGREHALCWKIAQSKKVDKIYCAPGNAGVDEVAECVAIGAMEFEKLADFGLGLLGFNDLEPVHAGALGGGRGDDLHPVPRFQLRIQRHHFPIDLSAHAGVADVGMDAVGKVQGGSAPLHGNNIALGGKEEHFFREKVGL